MKRLLFLIVASCLVSSCTTTDSHWGYEGIEDPAHWAELSKNYQTCRKGHQQSPVDLHISGVAEREQDLVIAYLPTNTHIVNNGHSIEFDMDEANFISVDNKRYELQQLHFHADSEHTVSGVQFPAEMHLVHRAKDGRLAVLALLIDIGESVVYDHIFDFIPVAGEWTKVNLHLEKFIPKNRERFVYQGSLTTPPCSEGVLWLVFRQHSRVPERQLQNFKAYYSHNFRPAQKTYERKIFLAR